jgi:hypothetical protein
LGIADVGEYVGSQKGRRFVEGNAGQAGAAGEGAGTELYGITITGGHIAYRKGTVIGAYSHVR